MSDASVNIENTQALGPRDGLWDVEETARFLRVSPSWVRDHGSQRRRPFLPCKRLGRNCMRFDPAEVRAFLEGLPKC